MVHDETPSQPMVFPAVKAPSGNEPVAGDAFGQVFEEGAGLLTAPREVGRSRERSDQGAIKLLPPSGA